MPEHPCNEAMVREHTAELASHEAQLRNIAQRLTDVNTRINEVSNLISQLAGNGRRGAIDQLRDEVHSLSLALVQDMTKADQRAASAHKRLDVFIPEVSGRLDRVQASLWGLVLLILTTALGLLGVTGHL